MSEKINRLTASNASYENIEHMVYEYLGDLGAYEDKEFERLKEQVEANSPFTLDWLESRMDPRAGKARLRPKKGDITGVRMLDRARAYKLMDRHRWLKRFHAIGIIRGIKKNRFAMRAKVQDFMLRHAYDDELLEMTYGDFDSFKQHFKQNLRDDFGHREIEAVYEFLSHVRNVLERVPGERPEGQNQSEQESQTAEIVQGSIQSPNEVTDPEADGSSESADEQDFADEQEPVADNEDVVVGQNDVLKDQQNQRYEEL